MASCKTCSSCSIWRHFPLHQKKASPNPEWTTWKIWKNHRFLGSTHCAVTVVNEGLLGFPTKKHDNPGGDSHAGWGADSIDPIFISQLPFHHLSCAMDNLWATRPSEQFLSRLERFSFFFPRNLAVQKSTLLLSCCSPWNQTHPFIK